MCRFARKPGAGPIFFCAGCRGCLHPDRFGALQGTQFVSPDVPTRKRRYLVIYRSCGHVDGIYGLSWTLDYERAKFFAAYACGPRRRVLSPQYHGATHNIAKATWARKDVLAYFSKRNEDEIVVDPMQIYLLEAREWRKAVCPASEPGPLT